MSDYDETPPDDPYADTPRLDERTLTEQSVLGGMMLSTRACDEVLRMLSADDLHVPRHGVIFDAIRDLHGRTEPTDVIAVTEELLRTGDLQRAGGADYLHTLTSVTPTAANAGYYAGRVREKAIAQEVADVATTLAASTETGTALPAAIARLTAIRDRGMAGTSSARSLQQILSVPESEDAYDWVIPEVLERRDRLMLTGGEGSGKSTLLRQLCILSAAGIHPFKFIGMEPVRVLVVDVENSERQWRRAIRRMADAAAFHGLRDPAGHVTVEFQDRMDITHAADLGIIHRRIDEVKPDLLMIGPIYRLIGGKPIDKEAEVAPVLAALDGLRDRGLAMLIEAHAGHDTSKNGERNMRPRGSSAQLGWPEFGYGLRREKQIEGRMRKYSLVRWREDRDARPEIPHSFTRGAQWPWEPTF